MHCVAGDGVGILTGAVLASSLSLTGPVEVIVEYVLGFAFGWMIFQALFMREMAGGLVFALTNGHVHPRTPFDEPVDGRNGANGNGIAYANCVWDRSLDACLLVCDVYRATGRFVIAYPMNWWLVGGSPII